MELVSELLNRYHVLSHGK